LTRPSFAFPQIVLVLIVVLLLEVIVSRFTVRRSDFDTFVNLNLEI